MTDGVKEVSARVPKKSRLQLDEEWHVSEDGFFARRAFSIESPRDASKLASRVVSISVKQTTPIELKYDGGTSLTVSIPRSENIPAARHLDRTQRGMAQKLDRFLAGGAKKQTDQTPA